MRIMFICHGNICRSPMAEYIMKELVRREGREDEFEIASCAVSCEELGNGVYPPARAELERRGIPCGKHRAVRLELEDYDDYDLFIVMDRSNLRWAKEILDGDPEGKLHLLMEYAGEARDVSDPWYSRRFDIAFDDIMSGCEGLLEQLS
jgi:protein-tyrosine phosphatase